MKIILHDSLTTATANFDIKYFIVDFRFLLMILQYFQLFYLKFIFQY